MRIISGTVKSTQTHWLPVLAHIAPTNLRRQAATCSLLLKVKANPNLPAHEDIFKHPANRLKSRNPVWKFPATDLDMENQWLMQWTEATVNNSVLIKDPTKKLPGFELPRTIWTTTNRIRTEQGRCNYLLYKWGMTESSLCDCGDLQMVKHIVECCPLSKYAGGMLGIHLGGSAATEWLTNLDVRL
jgi:hypothetical protein